MTDGYADRQIDPLLEAIKAAPVGASIEDVEQASAWVVKVHHIDGTVTTHSTFWSEAEAADYRRKWIPAYKVTTIERMKERSDIGLPYAPVVDFDGDNTPIVECPECGATIRDDKTIRNGKVIWSGYADHYANDHDLPR